MRGRGEQPELVWARGGSSQSWYGGEEQPELVWGVGEEQPELVFGVESSQRWYGGGYLFTAIRERDM